MTKKIENEKKTTKPGLAKIAIIEIVNLTGKKTQPEILKTLESDFGFKTNVQTVVKALTELIDEKIVDRSPDENDAGSFIFSATPVVKKRGWKTKLIKKLASQIGGTINRKTLARIICSDVRNTHILISCIRKSWDTKIVIGYDKKTESYNFS